MGGHFLPVQSKEDHFWIEAFCHQPSCYLPFLIFILVFTVWSMSRMFCLVTWWTFPVNSMVVMLILLYNCFFFQKQDFCYICVYNLVLFCFWFFRKWVPQLYKHMYSQSHWSMQHTIASSGSQFLLSNSLLFYFKSNNEFILEIYIKLDIQEKKFLLWKVKLFCITVLFHKKCACEWKIRVRVKC